MDYIKYAKTLKVLSDSNRLKIVDMLSCGELCGCKLLEELNITQPTLSHHMHKLKDIGIVSCRKEGKRTFYALIPQVKEDLFNFFDILFSPKQECICLK